MAGTTVSATTTVQPDGRIKKILWTGLATSGVGSASTDFALFSDRSVQFTGIFGTGTLSTAILEGSNDGGVTWAPMKDAFGNTIAMSSAGLSQITELVEQVRPNAQGGDSTTLVNAYLLGKKVYL